MTAQSRNRPLPAGAALLQYRPPEATIIPDVYGARGIYKRAVAARTGILLPFYDGCNAARFPKLETKTRLRARQQFPSGHRAREGRESWLPRVDLGKRSRDSRRSHARCPRCLFLTSGRKPSPSLITLTRRAEISRSAPLIMA